MSKVPAQASRPMPVRLRASRGRRREMAHGPGRQDGMIPKDMLSYGMGGRVSAKSTIGRSRPAFREMVKAQIWHAQCMAGNTNVRQGRVRDGPSALALAYGLRTCRVVG